MFSNINPVQKIIHSKPNVIVKEIPNRIDDLLFKLRDERQQSESQSTLKFIDIKLNGSELGHIPSDQTRLHSTSK